MTDISNHDHHDLDLIAAYASGEANPRAEALVASCTHCLAEYDLQQEVHRWFAAAPAVMMADHERAALRHRVIEQIDRLGAIDIGRRRRNRQPGQLILRIGAAAAGLAVLAGVSGVLGRLATTNGGASATTSAVAAESMIASGEDGDLKDAADAAGAPTATTAAMLAAEAGAQSRALPGGDADAVRREAQMLIDEGTPTQSDERVAAPPCVEEIDGRTPLRWAESRLDGEPIVIIVVEGPQAPEALVYRIGGCELVEL